MARKQVVSITIQQCAQVQRAAQADQSPKCQLIWRYLLNFCCQRWKRQQARCWQTWNQKHSFESKRMESWLEILYIWVFVTPIAGSWQVVSKIQKHSVDYFQPAYFCSQKRTSLTINSNHVQNRCQQINSGFWFGVFFGLGFFFPPCHTVHPHPKVYGYKQRIKWMLKGKMQGLIYNAIRTVGKGG